MNKTTVVSRRLEQCIAHLQEGNYEAALINLLPALDKTAKKRRTKDGVGQRIRAFLEDEEIFIHSLVIGRKSNTKIIANGLSVPAALYQYCRNAIVHEGELDPRLKFSNANVIEIGENSWEFPISYISALSIAVIAASENAAEKIEGTLSINIQGVNFPLNEIWGRKLEIERVLYGQR